MQKGLLSFRHIVEIRKNCKTGSTKIYLSNHAIEFHCGISQGKIIMAIH
jgi:hypothetical protein